MAQIYETLTDIFQIRQFNIRYGNVSQSENQGGKDDISKKIVKLIEDSRNQFESGFPAFGIPPLDPFKVENTNFYLYQKGIIKALFEIYEIEVCGFKDFVINSFDFQNGALTINFDFTLPEMILTAKYHANGRLASVFPFNPKGNALIEMFNMSVKGVANLKMTRKYLQVMAFQVILNVEKTKVRITGLLGNGMFNRLLNWALNLISDRVIQQHKDNLAQNAAIQIMDMANTILRNFKF